jgi:hypothetical protein
VGHVHRSEPSRSLSKSLQYTLAALFLVAVALWIYDPGLFLRYFEASHSGSAVPAAESIQ